MILATAISQVLPAAFGISPDMTAACFCQWRVQTGMMRELISNEYIVQKRLKFLALTPGAQLRRHIKSEGGYRC